MAVRGRVVRGMGSETVSFAGGSRTCPSCRKPLKFCGVMERDSGGEKVSIAYECTSCGRKFAGHKLTVDANVLAEAIDTARHMTGSDGDTITRQKLWLPQAGDPIAGLGKLCAIIFEKDGERYIHEYKKYPNWGFYPSDLKGHGTFLVWEETHDECVEKRVCPSCKSEMGQFGVHRNPGKANRVEYFCKKCNKAYAGRAWGGNPNLMDMSAEYTDTFKMGRGDRYVSRGKLDLPEEGDILVNIGPLHGLVYVSDKEGVKNQQYIHRSGEDDTGQGKLDKPTILFYPGRNGGMMFLLGGAMRIDISGEGRTHGHFPGWLVD